MRLCISIASILFVTIPAVAATVTVRPETPDRPIVVVIEGSLAAFDEDQFAAKTAPLSSAFVAFSSDGGSLVAGLRIGEAIRRKRFSTIVPDGRRCASACALAWLGGPFLGDPRKTLRPAARESDSLPTVLPRLLPPSPKIRKVITAKARQTMTKPNLR